LAEVFPRLGDLGEARGVTVRASTTTGEVLAVIRGPIPDGAPSWNIGVSRRDRTGVHPVIGDGILHETIGGATLRITGDAFFQNNTAGAEVLVGLVLDALDPQPDDTLLDGYAGGGLFSVAIGDRSKRVIAVEVNGLAVHDLTHNLAVSGVDHAIAKSPFEAFSGSERWDIAVVDPPREGLGAAGVEVVSRSKPRTIAYVSCDPASLARDARLLGELGYVLEQAVPVDLFPQTFHIETVARFVLR
jgi:23S rRNA (uracil1939-C5)-methyltransferase